MANESRKATTWLLDQAEEGLISWESIVRVCLNVMSEAEVKDMAEDDFGYEEEEEEEEEEE